MTGDRIKILMLNLPFLMRDLLRPEVRYIDIILTYSISATIHDIGCDTGHDIGNDYIESDI
jgi:hypothetical protein